MKTYGRTTILAPYEEKELIDLVQKKDYKKLDAIITKVLTESLPIHNKNRDDSLYLKGYLYGDQDIKNKVKYTREEINNKTVENWVWAFVDFKKAYLLGKPIQYVQINDSENKEISTLNQYVRYAHKKALDMDIYGDALVCGRGFRYTNKNRNFENGTAPFEIINCNPEDTEVVYSSKLGNEQLFAYIVTEMVDYDKPSTNDGGKNVEPKNYVEIQVYLRNLVLTYSDKGGSFVRIGDPQPLLWNKHIINEYYLNKKRISMVEIGKDLFDDINYLESLDKDDMEQFVNAILVFKNATVTEEDLDDIKALGAVCINSTEQKQASVDLLQGRLNANDTQTYYNRLLTSLHQILGVPMFSEYGKASYGDTGQARLTGQGYTDAGIRSEGDTTMFGVCDLKSLEVILQICKNVKESNIKSLNVADIDSKFQREMSENLLVKTQGLMNLYSCDIPRGIANSIVNLFSDPNAVTELQNQMFGEQVSQQNKGSQPTDNTTSVDNEINKQDNDLVKTTQSDIQGK